MAFSCRIKAATYKCGIWVAKCWEIGVAFTIEPFLRSEYKGGGGGFRQQAGKLMFNNFLYPNNAAMRLPKDRHSGPDKSGLITVRAGKAGNDLEFSPPVFLVFFIRTFYPICTCINQFRFSMTYGYDPVFLDPFA